MRAPLPVAQMNPFMLRYMGITATDAWQDAEYLHHVTIREHYASVFLADRLPTPNRYLADMELSLTDLTLRGAIGDTMLSLQLPVLRPTTGWMDGFLHAYHSFLNLPNSGRELRPGNQYDYTVSGGWNSRPRWELGNVTVSLQRPLLRDGNSALALLAGGKAPTANRSRGWDSGTWDSGVGFVDSFRARRWFGHLEAWYIKPFGNDYLSSVSNRAYVRASAALGWRGALFRPFSSKPFSLIVQAQGGMSPYRNTGMDALDQSPWLIAFGLRWQDRSGRDWSLGMTENITQRSTQDFSIDLSCSLG